MTVLLNLLAAVALLVWGTHLVRSGVLRIYGADLRAVLAASVNNRYKAFAAGLGVTSLIQSSTATALITTGFVGSGLIATAPALAIMLGADVGTSILAVVFSLDLSWLSPVLLVTGVALFLLRPGSHGDRLSRVLIGLGIIILALRLIVEATQPLKNTEAVGVIVAALSGDLYLSILVAAALTVLCYSSLAVVLLMASLTAALFLPSEVAFALVLGANLGGGLLAILATLRSTNEARRVALGNFMFKLVGCVALVPLLGFAGAWVANLEVSPPKQVVYFHLFFNIIIAAVFLFFTEAIARLSEKLLPSVAKPENSETPRYLDSVALGSPALANSCAAREVLRIGDTVETMLKGVLTVLENNDLDRALEIRKMDDSVDSLYTAVKLYLTQNSREALDLKESRRWTEIISFNINLEHVGDIIDKNLLELAEKKIRKNLNFSDAGMAEIRDIHGRVVANLQLALNIFINPDLKSAQKLLSEKERLRELERTYSDTHLKRLSDNTPQSIDTSALHFDIIRDLKRINSHICAVAYPILEQAGVLLPSRLRESQ